MPDDTPLHVRRITPDLVLGDRDATFDHYREVLGLEVVMDDEAAVALRSPTSPDVVQVLLLPPGTPRPDASIEVDDVDEAHRRARARDPEAVVYPLTDEPWGVRRFFVRDPSGNVVNVLQHREG